METTMNIRIEVANMKEAEKLSSICQKFPHEFYLRGDNFCVDPKSTLGVLAMMYSARDKMYIDTNEMGDTKLEEFVKALRDFIIE